MATEILSLDELIESQADKFITHNRGLRQLEGQTTRVLSRTTSDPTALTPSLGDTYIVPTGSVSPWDTHQDEIAHWYDPDGGSSPDWQYYPPVEGAQLVWVNDEDRLVVWDGTEWRIPTDLAVDEAITVLSVAGVVTLDLAVSQHFIVPLTENVTNIIVTNAPASAEPFDFFLEWIQTGAFTVTWPANFRWSGGVSPTITVTVGNADIHYHVSRDAGSNIWSHIFTADTSQDALLLVDIPQYGHMNQRYDDDYNQIGTAYAINLGWNAGSLFAFSQQGGDGGRGANMNDASNGFQCVIHPGRYTGKHYLEVEAQVQNGVGSMFFGMFPIAGYRFTTSNYTSFGFATWRDNGEVWQNGGNIGVMGPGWVSGDVLMLAFDLDNNLAYFGVNGTWHVGDPNTQTGGISWNPFVGLGNADEITFPGIGNGAVGGSGSNFRIPRKTIHQRPIQFDPLFDRNALHYTPVAAGPRANLCPGMIFQDCCFDPAVSNPAEYNNPGPGVFTREWNLTATAAPPLGVCQLQWPAGSNSLQAGSDYVGPVYTTIQPNSGNWYWIVENIPAAGLMELGLVDLAYPIATTKPSAYGGTAAVVDPTTGATYLNGVLQGAVTPVATGADGIVLFAYDSNTGLLWSKSIAAAGDAAWDLAGNPDTGAAPVWNLGAPVPMQFVVWLGGAGVTTRARGGGLYILRSSAVPDPAPSLDNALSFSPLASMAY